MAFLGVAPTGTVLPFAGSTAPDGWAICNSGEYSKTTYAALFAVIGITYGETNGSGGVGTTHFRVPDMRGVFPRGAGTNATSNYGGVIGHTPAGGTVGNKGGQKTAKNGLSNAASSISALTLGNQSADHTHSADHNHASENTNTTGAHTHKNEWFSRNNVGSGSGTYISSTSVINTDVSPLTASDGNHGHSLDLPNQSVTTGSVSANHTHGLTSGTAAAQTISSADTETTPASLSLNYIIKL